MNVFPQSFCRGQPKDQLWLFIMVVDGFLEILVNLVKISYADSVNQCYAPGSLFQI